MKNESDRSAIVYFDGLCNMCNGFVDFLVRKDRKRKLRFAPLQGTTAKAQLPAHLVGDLSTMVFTSDGQIWTDSGAALRAIASCGGIYSLASVLLLVPRFLRDFVYRWVANHRYLFAGRRDTCRLPTPEERELFLE